MGPSYYMMEVSKLHLIHLVSVFVILYVYKAKLNTCKTLNNSCAQPLPMLFPHYAGRAEQHKMHLNTTQTFLKFTHLKLQHGLSFVGLEHEAKCTNSCVGIVGLFSVSL